MEFKAIVHFNLIRAGHYRALRLKADPMTPESPTIESIELPLLLEAIWRRYGYDFREYAPASFKRRALHAMER